MTPQPQLQLQLRLHLHYTNCTTLQLQLHYATATSALHTIQQLCWGDHCNHFNHSKRHNSNHLSVHQWIRSAIHDSQQPTSPIGFLNFETSAAALRGTTGIYTIIIIFTIIIIIVVIIIVIIIICWPSPNWLGSLFGLGQQHWSWRFLLDSALLPKSPGYVRHGGSWDCGSWDTGKGWQMYVNVCGSD